MIQVDHYAFSPMVEPQSLVFSHNKNDTAIPSITYTLKEKKTYKVSANLMAAKTNLYKDWQADNVSDKTKQIFFLSL